MLDWSLNIVMFSGADRTGSQTNSRSSSPKSMQSDDVQHDKDILPSSDKRQVAVNGVQENSLDPVESSTLDWDANVAPTLEPADASTWSEGKATLIPGRPDFVMSYSTLPGQSAYRDRDLGSLYVHELVKCLSQRLEIDRALKLVSHGVAEELKKRDIEDRMSRFQLPFHLTSGMDKLLTL